MLLRPYTLECTQQALVSGTCNKIELVNIPGTKTECTFRQAHVTCIVPDTDSRMTCGTDMDSRVTCSK